MKHTLPVGCLPTVDMRLATESPYVRQILAYLEARAKKYQEDTMAFPRERPEDLRLDVRCRTVALAELLDAISEIKLSMIPTGD